MNNLHEVVEHGLKVSLNLHNDLISDVRLIDTLVQASMIAANAIKDGGKIVFAGNGGSFADAQHLAAEFIGTMGISRHSLPSLALGTNHSSTTAISNDINFDEVFQREYSAICSNKDFLILISTSGNSKNLIKLGRYAKELGASGLILTGKNGGSLAGLLPTIIVPHERTERIQEIHILLGHIFCELIENCLGYR